ncbi:MAG TPA: deoxyhypusine synthase [Euryarchaeota archaeon]|nr:putative deoxyhypusine synthase [archaeon BMS3Bbin15]HDL15722.1 deoxyhypusine synthase [Euryarchaeota archaeon]
MELPGESTEPVKIEKRGLSELLEDMAKTGFQGRKLGEAFQVWKNMLEDKEVTIFLGLSGAMVPAGMKRVISYLIRNNYIDVIVSTGANIFHDIHEAVGGKHYLGSAHVDDIALFRHGIDRIYDVFAEEEKFRKSDRLIAEISEELPSDREFSSREFINHLGKRLIERGAAEDSIIVSAIESKLPIFIPALGDSSIGIGLMIARRKGVNIMINQMKDVDEITKIVEKAEKTGVIYIGGGVPKNFIQQTEVIASILGFRVNGHEYAIQFTTDAPHWGGLSGCTFEEAVSWGKISVTSKKVQVFVDATIALPVVVNALEELGIERKRSDASFLD